MFESLDNIREYGSITLVIVSLMMIFASGIFFGVIYFIMGTTETAFQSMDCVILDNIYVGSCQDLWSLSVYPFLALKEILIWFSFFFIFALVLGMLIVGYQSGKSPTLLGLLVIFIIAITYGAIEISNVYRTMLEVDIFRTIMLEFTVYNKIMLYFPWFTFFVGVLSTMLSVVNYQKVFTNTTREEQNF